MQFRVRWVKQELFLPALSKTNSREIHVPKIKRSQFGARITFIDNLYFNTIMFKAASLWGRQGGDQNKHINLSKIVQVYKLYYKLIEHNL
jgi:hypothetical protein